MFTFLSLLGCNLKCKGEKTLADGRKNELIQDIKVAHSCIINYS